MDSYFSIYQPIYPIIDVPQFCSMVQNLWSVPESVDVSWLSSFLMVLALGCFALSKDQNPTDDFRMVC
jgi:hypothetical protein